LGKARADILGEREAQRFRGERFDSTLSIYSLMN
jgi:hypothetical protein